MLDEGDGPNTTTALSLACKGIMRFGGIEKELDLELSLKPVISELVRTEICFPNLKLLVDRILVVTLPNADPTKRNEAFKLILTDGEKTIQALLKRRMYTSLLSEQIREGSFVILKEYCLARAKRTGGHGEVIHLVIDDFYSIGEDGRSEYGYEEQEDDVATKPDTERGSVRHAQPGAKSQVSDDKIPRNKPPVSLEPVKIYADVERGITEENIAEAVRTSSSPSSSQRLREAMKRKWDTSLEDIDPNDPFRLSKYRKLEEEKFEREKQAAEAGAAKPHPNTLGIQISLLATITGSSKRYNSRYNVLVLIVSVSPETVKLSRTPARRDLRIMDTSTVKKVSLSVFLDAESFLPEPGTVALFKHLRIQESDGGSLKAYARDCEGKDWFVPDPVGFEHGEVDLLKDCWTRMKFTEELSLVDSLSSFGSKQSQQLEETGLPKKQLTCFYWAKQGSCRYTDDECGYAHYDTGAVANDPMHQQVAVNALDNTPSKGLTCYFWAKDRKCNRSDEECAYAHFDTGIVAHPPPQVVAADRSNV